MIHLLNCFWFLYFLVSPWKDNPVMMFYYNILKPNLNYFLTIDITLFWVGTCLVFRWRKTKKEKHNLSHVLNLSDEQRTRAFADWEVIIRLWDNLIAFVYSWRLDIPQSFKTKRHYSIVQDINVSQNSLIWPFNVLNRNTLHL